MAQFLLEDRELLRLHELLYGHAGLSVDDVVSRSAACLQVVGANKRIESSLLVQSLLLSSLLCVLVELVDWVHGYAVTVDGHLAAHLVQLQRVGLPLFQSLKVAVVDLLEAELPVNRLHAFAGQCLLLFLSALVTVRLVHACVVSTESLQS